MCGAFIALVFGRAWMFVYRGFLCIITHIMWLAAFFFHSALVFPCERYTDRFTLNLATNRHRISHTFKPADRNACDFKRMCDFRFFSLACCCSFFRFLLFFTRFFLLFLCWFLDVDVFFLVIFRYFHFIFFGRHFCLATYFSWVCARLLFEPFRFSRVIFAFHSLFFACILWIGNFFLIFSPCQPAHSNLCRRLWRTCLLRKKKFFFSSLYLIRIVFSLKRLDREPNRFWFLVEIKH